MNEAVAEKSASSPILALLARWPLATLFLLCVIAWVPGFFTLPPLDRDESRFAQASKQMIETDKMPVGGKLSDAEKQLLKAYIEQGRFPSMEAAQMEREAKKITPEARNWLAFRKPVKYAPPHVKNQDQVRTSIDALYSRSSKKKAGNCSATPTKRRCSGERLSASRACRRRPPK